MKRLSSLLLVWLLLATSQSQATEFWASDDGEFAADYSGFLKQQSVVYNFYDEPILWQDDWAGESLSRLRLGLGLYLGSIEIVTEFETRLTHQTSGASGMENLAGLGSSQSNRPGVWDIETLDSNGLLWDNDIDRLYVKAPIGPIDLTVGRQAISWGSSWFWKITDRFSPFSPMDFDPDVKRGVDGARVEWYLGPTTSLDLIATFEREPFRWNAGARFRTTLGRYDLALSAARFGDDYMGGAEFSGEIWDFGFRGEAAFTWNAEREDWDIQGVLGLDYGFDFGLKIATELFYNGYGTDESKDYVTYLFAPGGGTPSKSERLLRGETFNIGRYYVGLSLDQELHPLIHVVVSGITNVADPSTFLTASLQWAVQQNVRFVAGAMIAAGERPDVQNLKVPSEFGFYPNLGYAVLKVSF